MDKRRHLAVLLERYVPCSNDDKDIQSRFHSFVFQYENCFDRSLEVGHITASSMVLNQDRTKALFTHHRKLDRWLQLGGHCDCLDADILSSAIREVQEESGIQRFEVVLPDIFDLDIHLIPASKKEPAHYHYDVRFLLRSVEADEAITLSDESIQLKWVPLSESGAFETDPSVHRLFLKTIEYFKC